VAGVNDSLTGQAEDFIKGRDKVLMIAVGKIGSANSTISKKSISS